MDVENLEIIIGTYEEFLLGFKVIQLETEEYVLVQSFANHAHNASVRSVAAGAKYMATGSSDETIRLYDMKDRKEAGLLMHHHGNVNCLEFTPNGSHLVSGCENGSIGICRTGSWQLEKLWTMAHKGAAVTSISVHPSGKMLLSVGSDAAIRTWNLVKGRPAFTTHLCKPKEGRSITQVLWSPGGELYAVAIANRVEIFTVAKAALAHTIDVGRKVTCLRFTNDDVLCVGTEEGEVLLHDATTGFKVGEANAYDGRVRCLAPFGDDWLVTASSEGHVKLWWRKDRSSLVEVCGTKVGARVTCLAAIASVPAEQLLVVKAAAAASVGTPPPPATKKAAPRAGSAYVVVETAEETEKLALAAAAKRAKAAAAAVSSEEEEEEEEAQGGEEEADSVDEDEGTDEGETDEGETDDGDSDGSEGPGPALPVPMSESEISADSDDEVNQSNSKKRKRKSLIQRNEASKFVNRVGGKKAKVVLETNNGARRSVKKQNKKSSEPIAPPVSQQVSTKSGKKNSTLLTAGKVSSKAGKNNPASPVSGHAAGKRSKKLAALSTASPANRKAARRAAKKQLETSSSGAWLTD